MLNPVRAGAQAREFVGDAVNSARRGNVGSAVGMGALAAMSVPMGPANGVRGLLRAKNPSETLTGVALRNTENGKIIQQAGFDGGHNAITPPDLRMGNRGFENYEAGFVTTSGHFVNRAEARQILLNNAKFGDANRIPERAADVTAEAMPSILRRNR